MGLIDTVNGYVFDLLSKFKKFNIKVTTLKRAKKH